MYFFGPSVPNWHELGLLDSYVIPFYFSSVTHFGKRVKSTVNN